MFPRLVTGSVALLLALALSPMPALAQDNVCNLIGEAPDVIVGDIHQKRRHGQVGGITAFSIGTVSCNVGTCGLKWIEGSTEHPVIGQNMFRYMDGRFEQIGQSWLKHGFYALSENLCSDDCIITDGTMLGVNCSDPYSSFLNGQQSGLGPKFEVNAGTGAFLYPFTGQNESGDSIYKRLQVHDADLDPALNSGAVYYVEGQYVTADDAAAGNSSNNASYRKVTVSGSGTFFDITLTGTTARGSAAINAWPRNRPGVIVRALDVPNDGRMFVGSIATDNGDGTWRYEYAVQNLTSHRSGAAFSVPIPVGTTVTNLGFHDVDYHSGEPYDGNDWIADVDPPAAPNTVRWSVDATFDDNPDANALRWGTLYNFGFDADAPPFADGVVVVSLFRPGSPTEVAGTAVTPLVCNNNGVCDPAESCDNCPADCSTPGGQGGDACCGDGFCDLVEDNCRCSADCGQPLGQEFACNNGVDDDCDGQGDCDDGDCCADGACETGIDDDNDAIANCDCDDGNETIWGRPGEAANLLLDSGPSGSELSWIGPQAPGADDISYRTLRSTSAGDFVGAGSCVPSANPGQPFNVDAETPGPNEAWFYLIRAVNGCPGIEGEGDLGDASSGLERNGLDCP